MTRKTALVALAICLIVAGSAFGSNMGFKKTFTFTKGVPSNNVHWVSLPFFYTPAQAGIGTSGTWNTITDAEDFAVDMGGATTYQFVFRYNPSTGASETWTVGSTSSGALFPIQEGIAYGLKVAASAPTTVTSVVVGSHDNAYTVNYPSGTPSNNVHWISIPYHFKATDAGVGTQGTWAGVIDSEDLGVQMGGATKVQFIFRYNPATGASETWTVGSTSSGALFPISIGTGYGFKNVAGQTVTYAPQHY